MYREECFLMKRYVIIAGVNGAGKTTLYSTEDIYSDIKKVNFDEIVRSIGNWKNASDVKRAGQIALERINEYFDNGDSFSQETTLCGKSILKNISRAKELGYIIELWYVGLDSSETAKERVNHRMINGGHGIPEEDIERRYHESIRNLKSVLLQCDVAIVYDNTIKLTRIAAFRKGICEWEAKVLPQWYKQLEF